MAFGNGFGLIDLVKDIYQELAVLSVAGFAGTLFDAVNNPTRNWKRRAAMVFSGVLSAVFVGGAVAYFLDSTIGGGPWTYSAIGFLAGRSGEAFVKRVQDKFLGEEKENPK